jgi:hypothetical protein
MSAIKTPVTVWEISELPEFRRILDGDEEYLFTVPAYLADQIAAALNAATAASSPPEVIAGVAAKTVYTPRALRLIADHLAPQPDSAPVIPEGWKLVPQEPTEAMGVAGETVVIGDGGALDVWEEMLNASPPAPLHTETAVRAEARREALEEAAKAAEGCDSPFNSPTDEQHEAVDLMARRVADTIRALIDRP